MKTLIACSACKLNFLRLLLLICLSGLPPVAHAQNLSAQNLKVDHLLYPDLQVIDGYPAVGHNPPTGQQTVIANTHPTLGWELITNGPSTSQSAYRILLRKDQGNDKFTGETWDSGKVHSDESVNVRYAGPPLTTRTAYLWRVMVWDANDNPSSWSETLRFITADKMSNYDTPVYPLVKSDNIPADLKKVANVYRLDFGRASFGQLKMTLSAREAGESITMRLGEAIRPDGHINRTPGGTVRFAEYHVALRPGRHTYTLQLRPDKRNTGPQAIKMPAAIGEVLPFRYCEIEGYSHNLKPSDVVRATVHYPFNDCAADFESSDETLNAVWDLCKHSIKATSFAGTYVDGDRERIPYEADAYINQLCHYSVDNEYSMARHSHEYLLHHATWPTEWILQSVLMAYNDYLYTGDIRSAARYYGDLKAKLLLPLRADNGLISTTRISQTKQLLDSIHFQGKELRDIVDWPHTGGFGMKGNGETDGFVFTDYNAVVNAFHYKALRDMERLAEASGHTGDASAFAAMAEETYRAFQSLLWDEKQHAYRDGPGTDHASLHTNMMALAFGIVPERRREDVARFLQSRGMACSVYGSQFLMDAIYDAGDAHYGLKLLTSKSDRSWYNMIRAGSTISMEAWDTKYKPNQDWNHAWGAVPANIIPRKLMGIEPLTPGWKEFRVKPQPADLTSATIKVPTIRGPIMLSYRKEVKERIYTLKIPANSTAHVELPTGKIPASILSETSVTVNGYPTQTKTTATFTRLPPLPAGQYEIRQRM